MNLRSGILILTLMVGLFILKEATRRPPVVVSRIHPVPVASATHTAKIIRAVEMPPMNSAPASAPVSVSNSPRPLPEVTAQENSSATNDAPLPVPMINGYPLQDPIARISLSFVGIDPEANSYWEQAINDPSVPAEERKDLIEDLNEDGLSDPNHPDSEDREIIAHRIQLIEMLAPHAMDEVDAAAFAEAYKDLVNLYAGRPVD